MKKFLIISASFLAVVLVLITTLGLVKPNLNFNYDAPTEIMLYRKSSSAVTNGKSDDSYSSSSNTYEKALENLEKSMEVSMLDNLYHGYNAVSKVCQDSDGTYATWSSSLLSTKYAIRLNFEETQQQIVEFEGDEKLIKYKKIIILIDPDLDYQLVPVYFGTSSTDSSYEENPMLINIRAKKLIEFIADV